MNTEKILKYVGLSAAARGVVCGTDLVLDSIRRRKALCVVLSNDASDRTKKQISDKCAFYRVPLIYLPCDMYELGRRSGKKSPAAALAVDNSSLARVILDAANEN